MTGLMNQQYAHLAGLMLGHALGAEVLLPPAVCRNSFGAGAGVRSCYCLRL